MDHRPYPDLNHANGRSPGDFDGQRKFVDLQSLQESRPGGIDRRELPFGADGRFIDYNGNGPRSPGGFEDVNAYAAGRGSRLAKMREGHLQGQMNPQDHRTTNDLLTMLDNSMPVSVYSFCLFSVT